MDKSLLNRIFDSLFVIAFGFILSESVVRDLADDQDWQPPGDFRGGTQVLDRTTPVTDDAPDPRAQDREWCHVNDFWAADVQGLYVLSSGATSTEDKDPAVRLIELSIAAFDDDSEIPD